VKIHFIHGTLFCGVLEKGGDMRIEVETHQAQQTLKYRERLLDPRWISVREKILERDDYTCRCCGSSERLQVHHRQYHRDKSTLDWKKPWEYEPILLITVCESCHQEGHRMFPIPIKDI
jgi:5-methylcytosine-specific restriction endonuclease McrA